MSGDDLSEIVTLKLISNKLMKRIHKNYRNIVGFNTALIILGVTGILQPTVSALLHNTSTLYISLKSMENLLEEENEVVYYGYYLPDYETLKLYNLENLNTYEFTKM